MARRRTLTTRRRVQALGVLLSLAVLGIAAAVSVPALDRDRELRSLADSLVPAQTASHRFVVDLRGSGALGRLPAELARLTPPPPSLPTLIGALRDKNRPAAAGSAQAVAAEIDQRVAEARRSVRAAGSRVAISAIAAVVAILAALALVWRRFERGVLRPLADVVQAAGSLVLAEDDTPILRPVAIWEVQQTAEALELLRGRLVDQTSALRTAGEALRQRAPIVSAVREELAPAVLPSVRGGQVAARQIPAEGVLAGDWYDVVQLDGNFVGVCIGDVAGHGAETGILALQTKQLVVSALRLGLDPGKALGWTAEHLGLTPERFVTCLVAVINPCTGSCRYANAGHPPALVVEADGGVRELTVTGPLLGPYAGVWRTEETTLTERDVLLCFTDGLTEMRGENLQELGVEGLRQLVATQEPDVEALVERCLDLVKEHGGASVRDDLTVLAFARRPSPDDSPAGA